MSLDKIEARERSFEVDVGDDAGLVAELSRLRRTLGLRLTTRTGARGEVTFRERTDEAPDPDALIARLLQLAKFGVMIRAAAQADPLGLAEDVVGEVEHRLARTSVKAR